MGLPLPITAIRDADSVVIRRGIFSLPASSLFLHVFKLVQFNQRSSLNRGCVFYGCPPPKLSGVAQCDTVSASDFPNEREELLWQGFFLDPGQWWDYRPHKSSPGHPDFRHKTSKEVLRLGSPYKPYWVDLQLVTWDAGMREQPGSTSPMILGDVSVPCREAGYYEDSKVGALSRRCEEGKLADAVEALNFMVNQGSYVDNHFYYRLLKRCIAEKDLLLGRRVHAVALQAGYESNAFVANHIIRMYASHGRLQEAVQVFTKVAVPNSHMWAGIILAHARHGQPSEAIKLYHQMRESSVKPDNHIFVAVLNACATAQDLSAGKEVHADILGSGNEPNIFVDNSIVDMYSKCGSLEDAHRVFDSLPVRDVVTWNALIAGYAQLGLCQQAVTLYESMQREGITPANHVTFVCLLQACTSIGDLHQGQKLHAQIREKGLGSDVVVCNSLVSMYAKCGSLENALNVFNRMSRRDVVSWNALIAGYVQHGLGQVALDVYSRMQVEGPRLPNCVTFVCLLQACASVGALRQGRQLHLQIQQEGLEADVAVGNSLVDMYAKCGSLGEARMVFDRLPTRTVVTWTAMIAGYAQHVLGHEALTLYSTMQDEGISPVEHTFACLLQACASVGALHQGRQLHCQIQERGLEADIVVGSCLVYMYAKCGRLDSARRVFDHLLTRNVATWNALLIGYAEHSDCQMAMHCFEEMLEQGVKPDSSSFVAILVACSHGGLVHEGQRYFQTMVRDHGIEPTDYHYNCMVDLLGRSGHLAEAENILQKMPFQNHVVGWTSLLTACKIHSDMERGRRCFDRLVELDSGNATAYILLGNIYANCGRWRDVDRIERLRQAAGAKKKPGKACIEVSNKVHDFTVGEGKSDISSRLRSITSTLKDEGGHVPQTELVLKALSQQEKEDSLCGHAEKLALAYGLLNTPDGTTLLVTKNLRMCSDCHSSTKIMSRLERREIIVRDAHCVHHFLNGGCSCGDRH